MVQAPVSRILPIFIQVVLEKGLPGYVADNENLLEEEIRLSDNEIIPVLAAATYIGALNFIISQNYDPIEINSLLDASLDRVEDLDELEVQRTRELIKLFFSYRVIREDKTLDFRVAEAWWHELQPSTFQYPSALSQAIANAMVSINILERYKITR